MLIVRTTLLLMMVAIANAMVLTIEPHTEHCFFEDLKERDSFTVEFQVKRGGFLDIDVSIDDPQGQSLHSVQRQNDGRVTLSAQLNGLFKICFGNKFSSLTTKVIDFDVATSLRSKSAPLTEIEAARADDVTGIENSIFQLGDGLEQVEKELSYYRSRLGTHHATNESTNERVVYWSTLEAVMVVVVALWQVWYMRRFFEVRRAV